MNKQVQTRLNEWMRMALKEAQKAQNEGEVPVGAIVVDKNGTIVAKAHNQSIARNDPTAHAEILALRKAGARLKNYRLAECILVVTVEPCPMCAGAAVWSRIKALVFGARDERYGACGSVFQIANSPKLNHRPEIVGGILEHECAGLMIQFFKERRAK